MKRLGNRIKERWRAYWEMDEDDVSKKHLSQSDKRSLWYGSFMMSIAILALCMLLTAFNNIHIRRQNDAYTEEIIGMIAAYMASATSDEYDEIAQSIRNDLVFSEFGENIENAIKYIPNTAETCRTCMENYPGQIYLVSVNTGQLYELDLLKNGEYPRSREA